MAVTNASTGAPVQSKANIWPAVVRFMSVFVTVLYAALQVKPAHTTGDIVVAAIAALPLAVEKFLAS